MKFVSSKSLEFEPFELNYQHRRRPENLKFLQMILGLLATSAIDAIVLASYLLNFMKLS